MKERNGESETGIFEGQKGKGKRRGPGFLEVSPLGVRRDDAKEKKLVVSLS